ncbi:MAG: thiamine ABC transporter substrate-binding protein [Actinomycetota bacterium]|nr:thiamine ABC transporter substrate-binding protein [Actinomycetota bacterium]
MRHPIKAVCLIVALGLVGAACGGPEDTETPETLTLIAHDSFVGAITDETFAAFTEETGIEVEVLAAGDAGAMVNQAVLTKDNPLADVLFGVDDTFLSRALSEEIFLAHKARDLGKVDRDLRHPDNLVTPIDFGDVCINYDKEWFDNTGTVVPDDLDDLRASLYAMSFTVEHPATSSPGLAFMLATIDVFGEEGWLDWWGDMKKGGINVTSDWTTAYYADFARHGGSSAMVVSYASSPPAEVIFSEVPIDTAPTGVIDAGCYRQVEYAGILAGTPYPGSAGQLVDFLLSKDFQETIPLNWFVYPANGDAELPQEFVEHTSLPESPTRFDAEYIAENRDRWIDEWIEVMGN